MCRLALWHGINDVDYLAHALVQLDLSFGGQGSGYYNSNEHKYRKGLDENGESLAKYASKQKDGWHLYHTRLASVGGISDELCHPFPCSGGVLAHNGHWGRYNSFKEGHDHTSDTKVAADLVHKHGPGVLLSDTFKDSGVWLWVSPEKVLHIKRSSSYGFCFQRFSARAKFDKFAIFGASEPCWIFDQVTKGRPFELKKDQAYEITTEGACLQTKLDVVEPEPVQKTTTYTPYKSDWDDEWTYSARNGWIPIGSDSPDDCEFCEEKAGYLCWRHKRMQDLAAQDRLEEVASEIEKEMAERDDKVVTESWVSRHRQDRATARGALVGLPKAEEKEDEDLVVVGEILEDITPPEEGWPCMICGLGLCEGPYCDRCHAERTREEEIWVALGNSAEKMPSCVCGISDDKDGDSFKGLCTFCQEEITEYLIEQKG